MGTIPGSNGQRSRQLLIVTMSRWSSVVIMPVADIHIPGSSDSLSPSSESFPQANIVATMDWGGVREPHKEGWRQTFHLGFLEWEPKQRLKDLKSHGGGVCADNCAYVFRGQRSVSGPSYIIHYKARQIWSSPFRLGWEASKFLGSTCLLPKLEL